MAVLLSCHSGRVMMCRAVLVMWVMTSSNRWISDIYNVAPQVGDVNIGNRLVSGPEAAPPRGRWGGARRYLGSLAHDAVTVPVPVPLVLGVLALDVRPVAVRLGLLAGAKPRIPRRARLRLGLRR